MKEENKADSDVIDEFTTVDVDKENYSLAARLSQRSWVEMKDNFPASNKPEQGYRLSESDLNLYLEQLSTEGFNLSQDWQDKDFYEKTSIFMDAITERIKNKPYIPVGFISNTQIIAVPELDNDIFKSQEVNDFFSVEKISREISTSKDQLDRIVDHVLFHSFLVSSGDKENILYDPSFANIYKGDVVLKDTCPLTFSMYRMSSHLNQTSVEYVTENKTQISGSWSFKATNTDVEDKVATKKRTRNSK